MPKKLAKRKREPYFLDVPDIYVGEKGWRLMYFRKKPVVIEAYQTQEELDIFTLEGVMHAAPGDWIITGVNGEQYPCKPDIFEKTYEPVE